MCAAIDKIEWKYKKYEDDLTVFFEVNGDDIPIRIIMAIDAEKQIVRVASQLPFKMSEDKLMEGAVATCAATNKLSDGSFDYDITDGSISFRLTSSFRESLIGEELIRYLICCSCSTTDEYNDKFLAVSKGILNINDFLDNIE